MIDLTTFRFHVIHEALNLKFIVSSRKREETKFVKINFKF